MNSNKNRNRRKSSRRYNSLITNRNVAFKLIKDSMIEFNTIRSSAIKKLYYNSTSNELFVEYNPGGLYYKYDNVPDNIIEKLQQPDISYGDEINEIKKNFSFSKLEKFPWMSNNDCRKVACELFSNYLLQLDEDILIQCEQKNYLDSLFSIWKKKNPHIRSSLKLILNQLVSQGKLYIHLKLYYIFITSNERKNKRIENINISNKNNNNNFIVNKEQIEKNCGSLDINNVCFDKKESDGSDLITPLNEYNFRIITIINTSENYRRLAKISILNVSGLKLDTSSIAFPVVIHPHSTTRITIGVKCSNIGSISSMMTFSFGSFNICRLFILRCGDENISDLLKPIGVYKKIKKHINKDIDKENIVIIEGERPNTGTVKKNYSTPKPYKIPKSWKEKVEYDEAEEILVETKNSLNKTNYELYFHNLLWTEEIQMNIDMLSYNIEKTTFTKQDSYLKLQVPGLAEKRPSVLKGDSMLVKLLSDSKNDKLYKGYAHKIEKDYVLLRFHKSFHSSYIVGQPVYVQFLFKRSILSLYHRGVNDCQHLLNNSEFLLFPSDYKDISSLVSSSHNINYFNRNLNNEQKKAVENIVDGKFRLSGPYVIYGPPGTGKTSTIVEAVRQVSRRGDEPTILICAPSNAAADLICEKLATSVSKSEMFRYMSYQRPKQDVSERVLEYCLYDNVNDCFILPAMEIFKKFKFVVATCSMAATLNNYTEIEKGHFKCIFIDECGHGWEPEIVSSFSGLIDPLNDGILVVAGDPKQLGPIVRSTVAIRGGLDTSYLERLIGSFEIYARDNVSGNYNNSVITKLINCYRCHPDILKVPNELFYDGDLVSCGDPIVTHNLCHWEQLPTKSFPLIFHGVEGEAQRESDSPSWFNSSEAEVVLNYVKSLVLEDMKVSAKDIGIITPYRKQVSKIKLLLKKFSTRFNNFDDITVGSCEQFQGQERRVIIVSTVRSSTDFLESDKYFNLGFVSHPKRFNVAVTRAQALLIVVGNPNVLVKDPTWGELVNWCLDNNACKGAVVRQDESIVDNLDNLLENLSLTRQEENIVDNLDNLLHNLNLNNDNQDQSIDNNNISEDQNHIEESGLGSSWEVL